MGMLKLRGDLKFYPKPRNVSNYIPYSKPAYNCIVVNHPPINTHPLPLGIPCIMWRSTIFSTRLMSLDCRAELGCKECIERKITDGPWAGRKRTGWFLRAWSEPLWPLRKRLHDDKRTMRNCIPYNKRTIITISMRGQVRSSAWFQEGC